MDFYTTSFLALVFANGALAYQSRQDGNDDSRDGGGSKGVRGKGLNNGFGSVQRFVANIIKLFGGSRDGNDLSIEYTFLPVYVLVMASDWLQGPYLYPLYKHTLELPESVIAALFSTGFISGGISATFVGNLADRYGRRKAGLVFCVIYSFSCIMTLSSNMFFLFLGRVLGGIGTTLLFTVFEAWLVAEFHRPEVVTDGTTLNALLGIMTVLNSVVAVVSGLLSYSAVWYTDTRRAPFVASVLCLGLAFLVISRKWNENYRSGGDGILKEGRTPVSTVIKDKRILGLGMISTVFEGTMFLFVVFWSPAIISAREARNISSDPPFGLIFACFMAAMMLGSQLSSQLMPSPSSSPTNLTSPEPDRPSTFQPSYLLTLLLPLSCSSLCWAVIRPTELNTFWMFCLYEFSIGVYFPTMSVLKSILVKDEHRASVYALFRVPLNSFVFVGLALTKEGEAYRNNIFMFCGALLLVSVVFTHVCLH